MSHIRSRLASEQSGNVFSEYIILLGLVSFPVGLAIYGLGVPLARAFYWMKLFIVVPIP